LSETKSGTNLADFPGFRVAQSGLQQLDCRASLLEAEIDINTPLGYYPHMLGRPISVIELPGYQRRADELFSGDEQDAIVDLIAYEPTCGDLIPGTGGLRKVRVGRGGSGKRGGARVIYYFYNANFPALLVAIYAKNEKADVSAQDKRKFAALVKEITAQWQRK
jgi:hypothetical protein